MVNLDITLIISALAVASTFGGMLWQSRNTARELNMLRKRVHDLANKMAGLTEHVYEMDAKLNECDHRLNEYDHRHLLPTPPPKKGF